jgi:hypothetical protein
MVSFRRNRLVIFSLLIILLALLVGKVVWPMYLRAQSNLGSLNSTAAPAQPAPATAGGIAISCQQTQNISMIEYEGPGSVSNPAPVIMASYIPLKGDPYIGNIPNQVEWYDGTTFNQKSGTGSFLYQQGGGKINIVQDNVWGDFMCTNGKKAIYQVEENGQLGGEWTTSTANCGQIFTSTQTIRTYEQGPIPWTLPASGSMTASAQGLQACDVPPQSNQTVTNNGELIFQGQALCNPDVNGNKTYDMIVIKHLSGAGAGEMYVYAKGYGLAAVYDNFDVTTPGNRPIDWNASTDLCDLKPKQKTTASNYFEYNIHRAVSINNAKGQDVLDSLYNGYSVSCMPLQDYKLALTDVQSINKNCGGKYKCNGGWNTGWQIDGALKINASNTLFGLLRNEKKVNSNIETDSLPGRFDSIESYFSTRNTQQDAANQSRSTPLTSQPTLTENPDANQSTAQSAPDMLSDVYQSPLYKLLTLDQQCQMIQEKLQAVETLCKSENRIEGDPTDCALDQNIPGENMTQLALWSQVKGKNCTDLMKLPSSTDPKNKSLKDLILEVNPSMDTAYRPAFIVAATTFDPEPSNVETTSPDVTAPQTKQFIVLDYLEVKVPAFGSDFLLSDPSAAGTATTTDAVPITIGNGTDPTSYYRDPLLRTTDALRTGESIQTDQQKERDARTTMRTNGKTLKTTGGSGSVVGSSDPKVTVPILCYDQSPIAPAGTGAPAGAPKLVACDPNTNNDKIPAALLYFLNSNAKLIDGPDSSSNTTSTDETNRGDCAVQEPDFYDKNFYDDKTKRKIAEQAKTIVSQLEAPDQVGQFVKKKTIATNIHTDIPDALVYSNNGNGTIPTSTQLFFVSPHRYGLQYVQSSFLSFLTLEQQKNAGLNNVTQKLTDLGVGSTDSTGQFVLDPQKFSKLLRTDFTGKIAINSADQLMKPAGTVTDVGSGKDTDVRLSGQLQSYDDKNKDNNGVSTRSLFWKLAGQVASLPTRLMALVTTPVGSPLNDYTLACTGGLKNPNPFATEDWLLGRCKATPQPNATCQPKKQQTANCQNFGTQCQVCDDLVKTCSNVPEKYSPPLDATISKNNSGGESAWISDGAIATALAVSDYTCTPAEMIIGVMAKESQGLDKSGGDVMSGDPNQFNKTIGSPGSCDSPAPDTVCGSFQFTQFELDSEASQYSPQLNDCLASLQPTLPDGSSPKINGKDNRQLGASMCVAAARIWRGIYCGGVSAAECLAQKGKTYTCDAKAKALSSFTSKDISNGFNYFHCTDYDCSAFDRGGNSAINYTAFMQEFQPRVDKVRADLSSCKNPSGVNGTSGTTSTNGSSGTNNSSEKK